MLGHRTTVTSVAINGNHDWPGWYVVGYSTSMDWDTLQSHQSLSDLSIRGRVDLTTFRITEEVVQSIVAALSIVIRSMLAEITAMAHWVIDWTIGGRLLWRVITVVVCMVGIAIIRRSVHLSGMIVIARGGSCKILQVSNYCFSGQMWVCGETTIYRCCYIPLPPCP